MATKTAAPPNVTEATEALDAAVQTHDDLRRRAAQGDTKVTGAQLSHAAADVDLARVRLDAARQADADQRERDRLNRIDQLRQQVAATDADAPARRSLDAYDRAVAALTDLHAAGHDLEHLLDSAITDLDRLRPLPDGVEVRNRPGQPTYVQVDGRTWRPVEGLGHRLVAEAAAAATGTAPAVGKTAQRIRKGLDALADTNTGSAADRIRRSLAADQQPTEPTLTVRLVGPHNGHRPGELVDLPRRQVERLRARGVVEHPDAAARRRDEAAQAQREAEADQRERQARRAVSRPPRRERKRAARDENGEATG